MLGRIVLLMDVMPEKEHDWVYTRLFFPPPAWVKWRCPSLDNVVINLHDLIYEIPDDFDYNMDSDSDEHGYYDYYGSS
ncbi:unnamed protein product [Amaranthus hypochondriacus]